MDEAKAGKLDKWIVRHWRNGSRIDPKETEFTDEKEMQKFLRQCLLYDVDYNVRKAGEPSSPVPMIGVS